MFVKWFRVGLKLSDELVKLCFQKRRCMEKQISQDRGSGGGASSTATGGGGGGASGHPVGQRRSNWEVIEHYNPKGGLTGVPSSQTKVSTASGLSMFLLKLTQNNIVLNL